jgi:hypothetical protein
MVLILSAASCSKKSGGSSDAGAGGAVVSNATITVQANPSAITVQGTSTITATVKDINGNLVADGTAVVFSLNTSTYGSLSNSSVTTASGIATTTFTAGATSGSVTITATSIGVSNFTSLTVGTVPGGTVATGSIQFVSATPPIIGIKGAGRAEISQITFLVSDLNGSPVDGASVSFTMSGPNGGEYIGDIDSTPNTATVLSVNGNVSVLLHSGSIAGTVTIVATTLISGVPISSSSTPLSIGGGVASASHFTLARKPVNLEGFVYANLQSTVSAYIADRFGNYNVMNGTSVSFLTEAGAIDAQGITGAVTGTNVTGIDATPGDTGAANVIFRTQLLFPQKNVAPAVAGDAVSNEYFVGGNEPFYTAISTSGVNTFHPRAGWGTIVAATRGEETFLDENHDGLFTRSYKNDKCPYSASIVQTNIIDSTICECDGGIPGGYVGFVHQGEKCSDFPSLGGNRSEGFIDRPEDPFVDVNDDRLYDDGQTKDHPYEQYIDTNNNLAFDSTNGKWDGPDCQTTGCDKNKTIWTDTKIVFSGGLEFFPNPNINNCYTVPDCTSFANANASYPFAMAPLSITKGSHGSFKLIVGDFNLNQLQGGTTITVTATVGTLLAETFIVPDGLSTGPTPYSFTVAITATEPESETIVTVKVVTPDGLITEFSLTVPLI